MMKHGITEAVRGVASHLDRLSADTSSYDSYIDSRHPTVEDLIGRLEGMILKDGAELESLGLMGMIVETIRDLRKVRTEEEGFSNTQFHLDLDAARAALKHAFN